MWPTIICNFLYQSISNYKFDYMAKDPSLVSCNSASVVDSMPRYFAFHGVDLGSGPDPVTIFFYQSMENASNPGF